MQAILHAQMVNHDHSFFQDLDLQEPNGKLNLVIRILTNIENDLRIDSMNIDPVS